MLNCLPLYCVPSVESIQSSSLASDDEDASVAEVAHIEASAGVEETASTLTCTADGVQQPSDSNGSKKQNWVEFDESVQLCQHGAGSSTEQPTLSTPAGIDCTRSDPTDLPQAISPFEDDFSPLPNHDQTTDVFLTVDPFATELPNPLEARLTFSGICNSMEMKKWDLSDSDDDGMTEEGDLQVKYVDNVESMTLRSAAVTFTRNSRLQITSSQSSLSSEHLYTTPLPPPPPTIFPRYSERGGWLSKLSHRRG